MNSLETMILLACWISLSLALFSVIPFNQSREFLKSVNMKKELLHAKTACDTLFMDKDYLKHGLTIPTNTEARGNALHAGRHSYECVGGFVPGKEGLMVLAEKRWLK